MSRVWIPVFLAVTLAFVLVRACNGNQQNPHPVVTPAVAQDILSSKTSVDLTNQGESWKLVPG
jgi:hypothetical protein